MYYNWKGQFYSLIAFNIRFFRHEVHLTCKWNNAISGLIWGDLDSLINRENSPFTLRQTEPHVLSLHIGVKFNGECKVLVASSVNRNMSVIKLIRVNLGKTVTCKNENCLRNWLMLVADCKNHLNIKIHPEKCFWI